jgi:hypothetical protein
MPSSYDNDNTLRADAPLSQPYLGESHFGGASLRAHEKENSFAPALVSQEAAEATGSCAGAQGGDSRFRDGGRCRGSST